MKCTTYQLMRLVESTIEVGCQGKQMTASFLGVEKASDHVWREGVIYKLTEILIATFV